MNLQKMPPLLVAGVPKSQLEKAAKLGKKRCLLLPAQKVRLHQQQHPRNSVLAVQRTAPFGIDFLLKGSIRCWIQIGKRTTPKPTKIAACWCCNMCSYFSWGANIENIWLSAIFLVALRSFWITADNRRQPTVHRPQPTQLNLNLIFFR